MPLFAIRKFGYREDVSIRPFIGNQNYDAMINDLLRGKVAFIETTTTIDGQETKIQIEHMRRYGSAPALNEIKYTGEANKGYQIERTLSIGIKRDDIHSKEFARIKMRFDAKNNKDYPETTWLLIAFDDYIGFTSPRDVEILRVFAEREILPDVEKFSKLVLVGQSDSVWMEFSRT